MGVNMNADIRVVLMMPGSIGVEMDERNVVVDMDMGGQFEQQGVQAGWQLVEIDGQTYSDDLLRSKITGAAEYTVSFLVEEVVCCCECGNALEHDAIFCCVCGVRVREVESAPSTSSSVATMQELLDAERRESRLSSVRMEACLGPRFSNVAALAKSCHEADGLSACSTAASLSEFALA